MLFSVITSVCVGATSKPSDNLVALGLLTDSGNCGENTTWSYYEDSKTLIISGTGAMQNSAYKLYEKYDFENVIVEEGVTSIGSEAFKNCTSLKTISLPDSLEELIEFCFYGCSNLERITLPKNLKHIGGSVFDYCSSLTSIEIPSSVTYIGASLFTDCDKLVEIKVDPDNPVYDSRDNCHRTKRTFEWVRSHNNS